MSISNDIKRLLDIQDENIYFEENAIEYKEFKGKTAKFITGKLTYTPTHCKRSGENTKIIRFINTAQKHLVLRCLLQVSILPIYS